MIRDTDKDICRVNLNHLVDTLTDKPGVDLSSMFSSRPGYNTLNSQPNTLPL